MAACITAAILMILPLMIASATALVLLLAIRSNGFKLTNRRRGLNDEGIVINVYVISCADV